MQIWVDADACPKVIKEILYRAAQRCAVQLTLVANHPLTTPPSRHIRSVQVPGGFDVADSHIVNRRTEGGWSTAHKTVLTCMKLVLPPNIRKEIDMKTRLLITISLLAAFALAGVALALLPRWLETAPWLAGIPPVWGVLLVTGLDKIFDVADDTASALTSLQMNRK